MKKPGFRTNIIIMTSAFLLVTNLALGYALMHQSRLAMKTLIDERMLDIVNTASAMIDGDVLDNLSAEDRGSPEYQSVKNTLIRFRDNINLAYIYYVRCSGEKTFTFGIDTDPVSPAEFGAPVAYTEALEKAGKGIPAVDEEPYEDQWGRFYSAYSPVFNSVGEVAGVVTVDFKADWYERQLNQNARTIIIACLIFIMIGIGIVLFLTRKYGELILQINNNLNDLSNDINVLTGFEPESEDQTSFNDDSILRMGDRISELKDSLRDHITHMNTQANSMITAMASDYRSVYYVDLDDNYGICYRGDPDDKQQPPQGEQFQFYEHFIRYANNCVTESYREGFKRFIDPDNVREALSNQSLIAYRYLAKRNGREYYEMIRMAGVRRVEERDDHIVHAVGLGLSEIDTEMREAMARNEALAEALTMAEEANKAKTAFLSNMSHEIRTPMNAIIGLDTLAMHDDTLSDHTRDYLEKIGGSARHLLGIINDILDMSRIESGRIVLKKEEFSFSEMIEQLNTMVMSQCSDKGLTYECHMPGSVNDNYIGDDTRLKEILINILSNAVKFTEAPGKVNLTIEKIAEFEDQATLRFIIKDTGIGMDKEYIPKIFDAFSQEDSSRKNKYGSTGLGMAITKSIVEMMNGTINVESQKGVGTEFTVIITLKKCNNSASGCEKNQDSACSAADDEKKYADLKGRRILLAEDTEINAEIMMDVLEMKDAGVDHAENGRIAVDMFTNSEPGTYDAILMDIRMPEMDGLEAAAAIRALDRPDAKMIPIIALTANAFDEDVKCSLQAGMNAHLSKPVESEHLYQTLEELIYESGNE